MTKVTGSAHSVFVAIPSPIEKSGFRVRRLSQRFGVITDADAPGSSVAGSPSTTDQVTSSTRYTQKKRQQRKIQAARKLARQQEGQGIAIHPEQGSDPGSPEQ